MTCSVPVGVPAQAFIWSAEIDVERQVDFLRRDLTIPAVRLADWVVAH